MSNVISERAMQAAHDEIESLRHKLSEKDAEIERLNSKLRNLAMDCIAADGQAFDSWQQLAASQAREQQLLDTLDVVEDWFINRLRGVAKGGSTSQMIEIVQKAISMQKDTTALEAMIAKAGEVMREWCLAEINYNNHREIRAITAVTIDDLN